jgi:hypothetical protein
MRLHKNENCDFIRHKTLAISAIALLSFPATLNELCHTMNNCPPGSKRSKEWPEEAKKTTKKKLSGDAEAMCLNYDTNRYLPKTTGRGRDGSYLPPPAQIRTCGTTAYGSCLGYVTRSDPQGMGVHSLGWVCSDL